MANLKVVTPEAVEVCRNMAARINCAEGAAYAAACSLQVPVRGGDVVVAAEALVRALASLQDARSRLDAVHSDLLQWVIHGGVDSGS